LTAAETGSSAAGRIGRFSATGVPAAISSLYYLIAQVWA
jgi:hypothetical protein